MSDDGAGEAPDALYHWAPSSRRAGIRRRGLVVNSRSRTPGLRFPFVALSESAAFGLESVKENRAVDEPMDLWELGTREGLDGALVEVLPWPDGVEWRLYTSVPARHLTLLGTRDLD